MISDPLVNLFFYLHPWLHVKQILEFPKRDGPTSASPHCRRVQQRRQLELYLIAEPNRPKYETLN